MTENLIEISIGDIVELKDGRGFMRVDERVGAFIPNAHMPPAPKPRIEPKIKAAIDRLLDVLVLCENPYNKNLMPGLFGALADLKAVYKR